MSRGTHKHYKLHGRAAKTPHQSEIVKGHWYALDQGETLRDSDRLQITYVADTPRRIPLLERHVKLFV
jgi:hypothetical protein